jgi:hypothetical protein
LFENGDASSLLLRLIRVYDINLLDESIKTLQEIIETLLDESKVIDADANTKETK